MKLAFAKSADNDLKQVSHVLPPVKAHTQVLGEDHISAWVFVPVLLVQLPDIAPFCRAVFLSRTPVHAAGIKHGDSTTVDHKKTEHEFDGVPGQVYVERVVHGVRENRHELKEIHAVLIHARRENSQIQHEHGERRPQWGGVPKRLLTYIGITPC